MSASKSSLKPFLERQLFFVPLGSPTFVGYLKSEYWAMFLYIQKKILWTFLYLLLFPVGIFLVLVKRAISLWFLIRVDTGMQFSIVPDEEQEITFLKISGHWI